MPATLLLEPLFYLLLLASFNIQIHSPLLNNVTEIFHLNITFIKANTLIDWHCSAGTMCSYDCNGQIIWQQLISPHVPTNCKIHNQPKAIRSNEDKFLRLCFCWNDLNCTMNAFNRCNLQNDSIIQHSTLAYCK